MGDEPGGEIGELGTGELFVGALNVGEVDKGASLSTRVLAEELAPSVE